MFSTTDYDNLQQIMEESPEKKELLTRLLESQRMEISTISHEIRNPLTLVYSTLQLIETQHPEVLSFRHWDAMHQDIEYMKQLLEELSSYNNGERLTLSDINADVFLKTLALSFASSILDTEIEFTSRIAPNLPVITIDSIKIRQTLLNLLSNARDAVVSCPDCKHPSITLNASLTNKDTILQIKITDTGCGISEENLPSIFEPFVTHKSNGTGLGLAIARRIITAHQGSITVTSSLGKGTSFIITLPVQKNA
ncbi:sensor histidine kinase [Bariatricus sp. SGI.154]|uniref:sensor histidine kinase n=1 Tax=Bariatricus sp. SGI.154 TaxID=3420549 RepID=UPI003D03348F